MISRHGPMRALVVDPETGEEFWHSALIVEAAGTDGLIYHQSVACTEDASEELVEQVFQQAEGVLRNTMIEKGVWPECPQ